jgi:hypothetical protein
MKLINQFNVLLAKARILYLIPAFAGMTIAFGCGYTQKATLPEGVKTIHVETVINKIPIENIYAYQPGLEMSITKAIIRRLITDGNLKVVARDEADAILETKLIRFEQEGLRYNSLEAVEEFRLYIVVELRLVNAKTGQVIWEEPNFSGDAEYFVSAIRSIGREEAARRGIERLARNVVDRIVEDW